VLLYVSVVYNDKVRYFFVGVQSRFVCFYFGFIEDGLEFCVLKLVGVLSGTII